VKAFLRRWWPLALVLIWAAIAWVVQPRSPLDAIVLPGTSAFVVFAVLAVALIVAFVKKVERSRIIAIVASLLVCLVVGALSVSLGPFGLRMLLSREQLYDAAMLAVQGKPPETPVRIGSFEVDAIAVDGGVVRFRIYEDELGDQGIAYFPAPLADPESGNYSYISIGWHKGEWYIYERQVGGT